MNRREPDWPDELRLSMSDEPAGRVSDVPAIDRPAGGAIPVRWCALLAVLALALAAAGGSLLTDRRGRTVTSTLVRYEHPNGVDPSGCPRGDLCMPLPAPEAALGTELPAELAHGTVLASSLLLDTTTSATIRTVQVLAFDGFTLTVTGQCIAGAAPVPAGETAPAQPVAGGPTQVALVRPGRHAGCSVALLVQAPAGKLAPLPMLRRLADQLPSRLVR